MTEQEAIKCIEDNMGCCSSEDIYIASNMAIAALEKQIPKKPVRIDYESYVDIVENANFLRGAYWCPNCKTVIRSGCYCDYCGQAINWSE